MGRYTRRYQAYDAELMVLGMHNNTPSQTDLNSAYTYNSAGACWNQAFIFDEDGTITDIWFVIVSFQGTWGSTDGNIQVEIRNADSGTNFKPGTLVGSENITLAGTEAANTWIQKTLATPLSVTANRGYYVCFSDSDGGATNFLRMRLAVREQASWGNVAATSTNGFNTAASHGYPASLVVKQNGNYYGGSILYDQTVTTSNQRKKGWRLKFPTRMVLHGVESMSTGQMPAGAFRLFKHPEGPGGTPVSSMAADANWPQTAPFWYNPRAWSPPYTMDANTVYYLVTNPSVNQNFPLKANPFASAPTAFRVLLPFRGECHWVEDDGAGGWTTDPDRIPTFQVYLSPADDLSGGTPAILRPRIIA